MTDSISKLSDDVLLTILKDNTDILSDETALPNAIKRSHVSQHWRSLMLSSPSLWAKLINLDILTKQWKNEILLRSAGGSKMAIYWSWVPENGQHERSPHWKTEFLILLLQNHYPRIQKLELCLKGREGPGPRINPATEKRFLPKQLSSLLFQPMESLEVCILPNDNFLQLKSSVKNPLFANHAPRLRTLDSSSVIFKDDLLPPYFSGLTDLTFSPKSSYNLVLTLKASSQLKALQIKGSFTTAPVAEEITLPFLQNLGLFFTNAESYMFFNNNVSYPATCSIAASFYKSIKSDTNVTELLTDQARLYYLYHPSDHFSVSASSHCSDATFCDGNPPEYFWDIIDRPTYFALSFDGFGAIEEFIPPKGISTLSFFATDQSAHELSIPFTTVATFLGTMTAVKTVRLHATDLIYFQEAWMTDSVILHALTTFLVDVLDGESVLKFLEWCKIFGRQVDVHQWT